MSVPWPVAGNQGGPFTPLSFQYQLSTTSYRGTGTGEAPGLSDIVIIPTPGAL
jgi:hypothetical protein